MTKREMHTGKELNFSGVKPSSGMAIHHWMDEEWHKKILFSTEAKIQAVSWGEDPEINNFYSALAHWAKGLQCH